MYEYRTDGTDAPRRGGAAPGARPTVQLLASSRWTIHVSVQLWGGEWTSEGDLLSEALASSPPVLEAAVCTARASSVGWYHVRDEAVCATGAGGRRGRA